MKYRRNSKWFVKTRSRFVKFCVCQFVCVLALRHPYISSKVTQVHIIFRYHSKFFFDRKFTGGTILYTVHHVFTFSWKYSSRSWKFQWPVLRKAVLFHVFISTVNNTNYSSYDYRVELDNHRQCLSTRRQTCTWMFLTMISYYDLMCKLSEECWDRRRAETTTLD